MEKVIVVVGPTGVGKTKMGVALAAPILCYQPLKYSDWALTYNMFRFQQGKCK